MNVRSSSRQEKIPRPFGYLEPKVETGIVYGAHAGCDMMSTSRQVTLFDIADVLGISTDTVHRALHDHPGVNPMTRMRVLQVSKNLGYRPNVAARLLSQKRAVAGFCQQPERDDLFLG